MSRAAGAGASRDTTTARPIRVLHIIVALGVGGAERLVITAVSGLPAPAFEHVVCCLAERGALAGEAEAAGARVECLGEFPGLRHPAAFARLYRLIRAWRPDIVHTHLQAANLYGRCAAWLACVPVIVATEHNVYSSKARRYIAIERLLARRTTALVAVSDEVRRFLAGQLRVNASAIRLIRNGVARPVASADGVEALRRRLSIPEGRVVVGTVASLTRKKGHEYLFQAVARLRQRDVAVSIVLAGDGPERARLESLAAELEISPDVYFLGNVSRPADVLALVDIFVLPSVIEGLPLALLEAMAAGKPVVATAVGGVPEAVTSGVNGILVPPGSAASLADAIEALARSPQLRHQYGAAALAKATGEFLAEKYVGALSSLYMELVRHA